MKAASVVFQIRNALANLNPSEVREEASRPVTLELHASSPQVYEEMANYFAPATKMSDARRASSSALIRKGGETPDVPIIRIYEEGMPQDHEGFVYHRNQPEKVVCDIVEARSDLKLALARRFTPFRKVVADQIIFDVAKENTMFSVATSLPALMPLFAAPWAIGEFASDTAFLTMNQVRMAFLLAAASDRTVGYREQKGEIASLFAGAFGWRAIARELIGVIPMGAGIIPKAGIAFAATYVVGVSLERYYRIGYGMTPAERKQAYQEALEKGKQLAANLLNSAKSSVRSRA